MKNKKFTFSSKIWKYDGQAAWHFVSLPKILSKEIRKEFFDESAAWGSIKVIAKIGKTEWDTSIFPDTKLGCYLLPIKAKVRKLEGAEEGDRIEVSLLMRKQDKL